MKDKKISLPLRIQTFETILNYLVTVKTINRKFLRNVQKLLEVMDRHTFVNLKDIFVLEAIDFIISLREHGCQNLNFIKLAMEQSPLDGRLIYELFKKAQTINVTEIVKEEYELSGVNGGKAGKKELVPHFCAPVMNTLNSHNPCFTG